MSEYTQDEFENNGVTLPVNVSSALEAEIAGKRRVEARLEEKYADRGLKFTRGFSGSTPVQAWGVIDGYRFYFRYRTDAASIRIGFIAEDRAEREYQRDMKFHQERVERSEMRQALTGELDTSLSNAIFLLEPKRNVADGITDYPSSIRKQASISGVFNDPYNGHLSPEQAEYVFVRLIENLEEVSYEDPVTIEL